MSSPDRLSSLIAAFNLKTEIVEPASGLANLLLLFDETNATPLKLLYRPGKPLDVGRIADAVADARGAMVTAASVDFGGPANPLVTALAGCLKLDVEPGSRLAAAAALFAGEAAVPRCGRGATLDRLCEVMVVLLLRNAIETGATHPGLLAGLADARLHRALVAIHDHPGKPWNIEQLAEIAGMSRSHFLSSFRSTVGKTPAAYLTAWRLTLARQDLRQGDSVKAVSGRYGFGSTAALSRAFSRLYGFPPSSLTAQARAAGRADSAARTAVQ
jgi:AraC-like DNA-binding protein